jgi:hypothetical protein
MDARDEELLGFRGDVVAMRWIYPV